MNDSLPAPYHYNMALASSKRAGEVSLQKPAMALEMRNHHRQYSSRCLAEQARRLRPAKLDPWQTDVSSLSYIHWATAYRSLGYADRNYPVNEARAMRVAEVMNDFHLIQRRMSHFQATPSPDEYHEEGFVILRQCQAEARAILAAPFQAELLQAPRGPDEAERRQLQR